MDSPGSDDSSSALRDSGGRGTSRWAMPAALVAAAILSGLATGTQLAGHFHSWQTAAWVVAVGLVVAVAVRAIRRAPDRGERIPRAAVAAVVVCLVAAGAIRATRVSLLLNHPDEYAFAYFSTQFDPLAPSFFGPVPPEPVWTVQTPSPFFVVQKAFLAVFGTSPLDVKRSAIPFALLATLAVFALGRALFDWRAGLAAAVVYAVLAPAVYMETFGLVNGLAISAFTVLLGASVAALRRGSSGWPLIAGVAAAFCYLSYTIAFTALPLLFVFAAVAVVLRRPLRRVAAGLGLALLGMAVTLAPFVAGGVRSGNYMVFRLMVNAPEVAKFLGLNVPEAPPPADAREMLRRFVDYLRYFVQDGVGGVAGYDFGHVAVLDHVTLAFVLLGMLSALLLLRRRPELGLLLLTVAANLAGMALTNPPPHLGRIHILTPAFAVFAVVPAVWLMGSRWGRHALAKGLAAASVVVLVVANSFHLERGIRADVAMGREDHEDIKVAEFLLREFPGHDVVVAAYPGFHLEYTLGFFMPQSRMTTRYHDEVLKEFDPAKSYVVVILFPEEFDPKFQAVDPRGTLRTDVSSKYGIFYRTGPV